MELKAYLRILGERWWIILLAFAVTYATTLAFTFIQVPQYESRATFVVKQDEAFGDNRDLASALDILGRRPEIATTFSTAADSRSIKTLAADALALSQEQRSAVDVSSRLVPGTMVLEITGEAYDPVLARDFTNEVGVQTIAYVRNLDTPFNLVPLDQANLPTTPSRPNRLLNLSLGAVLGLVWGVGWAFLAAYLQQPAVDVSNFGIRDEETGAYSKRYFVLRLRQELSRAKRNGYPLSISLINLNPRGELDDASPQIRQVALRTIALRVTPHLRDEDMLARFNDTTFALLFPDTLGETAKASIDQLQTVIAASPVEIAQEGIRVNIDASAGVASYLPMESEQDLDADDLIARAMRALKQAELGTYGRTRLLPDHYVRTTAPNLSSSGQATSLGNRSSQ